MRFSEQQAIQQTRERLAELLDTSLSKPSLTQSRPGTDIVLSDGRHTFLVECKSTAASAIVAQGIAQLKKHTESLNETAIPLLVVPYMGELGDRLCREAGVAWLDLSGNARIYTPDLRILMTGQPNRFKQRGRPASVFAPKSSRIARWLLMHSDEPATQRAIAQATDMDEGLTSHVIARMREQGLVTRDKDGLIRLPNPALLLDAWRETHDFSKHDVLKGHVVARSGDALLRHLADSLEEEQQEYAATGLGAAWLMTHHAGFRLVTLYLQERPAASTLERLGFRDEPRGANTWLVVPNDAGVFDGATKYEGIRCVHPVQVYLDLKAHPERAAEAATVLRSQILSPPRHAG